MWPPRGAAASKVRRVQADNAISAKIRGYTDKQSVAQGQSIHFYISNLHGSDLAHLPIRIVRLGRSETEVASGVAAVHARPVSADRAWENNNWDISYTLTADRTWRSGVYAARVGQITDDAKDIFFVVKNTLPDLAAPIVVQIPTTTMNAYNNWGGASLYGYNSTPFPAHAVSFNRPQQSDPLWPRGYGFEDEWDLRIKAFVQWMEIVGYAADFVTNNDLHECKELLQPYRLFISIGHDEYWSRDMRNHFDAFVAAGGNAAIFGGNTCYWQIRLEPDEKTGAPHRRQVCYKAADKDPIMDPGLKTTTWREVGYPENLSFGAGFASGAWRGNGAFGAFTVYHADHWVFSQTMLRNGDSFGNCADERLLGYETNAVDHVFDERGIPVPIGADGSPANYLILALAELPDWGAPGNAAMGVFTNPQSGGTVFNAATTEWANGLQACLSGNDLFRTVTAKITRNVITQLTLPKSTPKDNRRSPSLSAQSHGAD
jgi:hypothetical protein